MKKYKSIRQIIRFGTPVVVALVLVVSLCAELVASRVPESGTNLKIDTVTKAPESFADFDPFSVVPNQADVAGSELPAHIDQPDPVRLAQVGGQLAGRKTPVAGDPLNPEGTFLTCFVWGDYDLNGRLNLNKKKEKGAPNARVKLFSVGADGVISKDDQLVAWGQTRKNGTVVFDRLTPGIYYVKFTQPIGWNFTFAHKGSPESVGSDANFFGRTPLFTLDAATVEFHEKASPLRRGTQTPPGLPIEMKGPFVSAGVAPIEGAIGAAALGLLLFAEDDVFNFISPFIP